jgi:signal transduction histidine kinase
MGFAALNPSYELVDNGDGLNLDEPFRLPIVQHALLFFTFQSFCWRSWCKSGYIGTRANRSAGWGQMALPVRTRPNSRTLPPPTQGTAASSVLLVVGVLIAAAVFVADTVTQLEIAVAVLYVAVILIAVRVFERQGVLIVALACVALTILSYFLSREEHSPKTGFINCAISIAAILASTYLALRNQTAITALHEAQTELAHANRVTAMGELTAAIVHEVNQPIAGVVANADAAMRWLVAQPPDLEEARQALESIVEDGQRTSDIVSRVRALARKVAPRRELLDINQVIRDVIALTRTQIQRNDVALLAQLAGDIGPVSGDRVQMQQVILNLILNAVEAMASAAGHRELRISTTNHAPDGVLVAVTDSGPGLGAGDLDRLFAAFYTTKSEGMGMGLSICRTIVEAHGGRVWASQNAASGATLQFTLPRYAGPLS